VTMDDLTRPRNMKRPGGRTEVVRKAVATTVLDLLGEGRLDFTVSEVAQLAGVGRRTIHRRWPNRIALLREALAEHHNPINVKFSGDLRRDVYKLAVAVRDFSVDPHEIALNRLLTVTDDEEFSRELFADFDMRVTKKVLAQFRIAQQEGRIRDGADIEIMWAMLVSTIFTLCFIVRQPPDNRYLRRLVNALMEMFRDPDGRGSTLSRSGARS
jgi:AcrR family transcriptional regulator